MEDRMAVKHVLQLARDEREALARIAKGSRGRQVMGGWKVTHAKAWLKCDQGPWGPAWPDHRMAEALDVTERSLQSWRKSERFWRERKATWCIPLEQDSTFVARQSAP